MTQCEQIPLIHIATVQVVALQPAASPGSLEHLMIPRILLLALGIGCSDKTSTPDSDDDDQAASEAGAAYLVRGAGL